MLSAGGGCELVVTIHVKMAWKKIRELLPFLTSNHLSYKTHGHVYSSCVQSAMLHASETWPLTMTGLGSDRSIVSSLYQARSFGHSKVKQAELDDLDLILRERRLRWFEHVEYLVVQSKQHVIYRLEAGGARETQADTEETDRKSLP